MLGEIKRYIRYNSLKLSFLKIRIQFFSRLRNRGFKKLWLRRIFSVLKYEDRQKLMEDSHFSDPESQVVLEIEAEGLMARDLEGILERESLGTRTKIVPVFPTDLPGTKTLFAAGPPIRLGGTLSVNPYCNVQENGSLYSKYVTSVNQGSTREPTATTEKTMVEKIALKRSAVLNEENSNIFLILPSYAAKHKVRIREILTQEKEKLWRNDDYSSLRGHIGTELYTEDDKK